MTIHDEDDDIGMTGPLVDLFNKELTQEEWKALCIVHKLTDRLNIQIQFNFKHSIDVIGLETSQIIDEEVFLSKILEQEDNKLD